ncbi:MAG: hypothetical protein ACREA1_06525, partial [Nitrosotalea sp.]
MKIRFALAFACAAIAAIPARADVPSVLSASDARIYREIFEAQRAGEIGKAEALTADLSDKSLKGYVLAHRYLEARHYKTSFGELKAWMDDYAELPVASRIYKLAIKRRPSRKTYVPGPESTHLRVGGGGGEAYVEPPMQSELGARTQAQFRGYVHDGQPDTANAILNSLSAGSDITQADIDRLASYVATSYLAEARDTDALQLAERVADRGRMNAPMADWVAGLAAYRLHDYARAGQHFEALTQAANIPKYTYTQAAFWAARSYQRSGDANRVVGLYARASSEPGTFYGMLAVHLLGSDKKKELTAASYENGSFNG